MLPGLPFPFVVSTSQFVYFVLMMFIGRVLDRFGPRGLIITGMTVLSAGAIVSGYVQSVLHLNLTYGVVMALGYSMATINVSSVAVTRWFVQRRGLAMGIALAGFNAGQLVILPLTQYWALTYGWRNAFVALGVVTLLLPLPLALVFLKDGPYGHSRANEAHGKPAKDRSLTGGALRRLSFWYLAVSFVGCGFSDFVIVAHLPAFAVDRGVSPLLSGSSLGFISGISILGVIVMGALSDRVGRRRPLSFIYLVRAACFFFLPWMGGVTGLWVFIVCVWLFLFRSDTHDLSRRNRYFRHGTSGNPVWVYHCGTRPWRLVGSLYCRSVVR